MLTGTTADTLLFINDRNLTRTLVGRIAWHHLDSARWTAAGTKSAVDIIIEHHAILIDPVGGSHFGTCLDSLTLLLLSLETDDGACRTDIRATGTFRTAVTALKAHGRSHHIHQIAAWTKHAVRTLADAKLTACAVLLEMTQ